MTGGSYSLMGGFWSLISAVQMAGAPPLYISHNGNTVTIYWQNVTRWNLKQNTNLSVAGSWSASGDITNSNGTNYLSVSPPLGNWCFRLSNQ